MNTTPNKMENIISNSPLDIVDPESSVQIEKCQFIDNPSRNPNLRCLGRGIYIISNCVLSNEKTEAETVAELSSIGEGVTIFFYRCRFASSMKGILVGEGERYASNTISATFVECIFEDIGKYNPFVRYGQARLVKCIIRNWGTEPIRNGFGFKVGKHAQGLASGCLFIQKPFFQCLNRYTLKDIFFQGYPFLVPGFMKAAFADCGGQIKLYNCYKNRWWLYLKNHHGRYMSSKRAKELEKHLEEVVPERTEE